MSKRVSESFVELAQFMMPEHANLQGTVHGGIIMKLVDEAGALCAVRHAQKPVVTVAIDSMTFLSPVNVGDVLILKAFLTYVGRTSMEVEIKVMAENPLTSERSHTNSAFAVYVALDENQRPAAVPELATETAAEQERYRAGQQRQERRRQQESSG